MLETFPTATVMSWCGFWGLEKLYGSARTSVAKPIGPEIRMAKSSYPTMDCSVLYPSEEACQDLDLHQLNYRTKEATQGMMTTTKDLNSQAILDP